MAENKKSICTLCEKVGMKPFTKENIFYYYIPLHGVVSYAGLSLNVMNPKLLEMLAKKDMTNVLLVSSLVGTAFYIYGRPHLKTVANGKRGGYALLGGSLFSMGSVLGWAVIKSTLPKDNSVMATLLGLITGAAVIKIGTDYLTYVDKIATGKTLGQ